MSTLHLPPNDFMFGVMVIVGAIGTANVEGSVMFIKAV